jgi:hypothetical protein
VLNKVQVFSARKGLAATDFDDDGRSETDLVQIRNIDGLMPVKASIGTSSYGSVDGATYTGSRVDTRNIILTLHPNPDWKNWSYESIRSLLYKYFTPKQVVELVFERDNLSPVKILGYVEDFGADPFSNDIEFIVSIICPDPYFTEVNPTIITGITAGYIGLVYWPNIETIEYDGDIEVGFKFELLDYPGTDPARIQLYMNQKPFFVSYNPATAATRFGMNSVIGERYVREVDATSGLIHNLFSKVEAGYIWPEIIPGTNELKVVYSEFSGAGWSLTYYKRFGGL